MASWTVSVLEPRDSFGWPFEQPQYSFGRLFGICEELRYSSDLLGEMCEGVFGLGRTSTLRALRQGESI